MSEYKHDIALLEQEQYFRLLNEKYASLEWKLYVEALRPVLLALYMDDEPHPFVMHDHWRGKGAHMDHRWERWKKKPILDGMTVAHMKPGVAKEDVTTLRQARSLAAVEKNWKISNEPGALRMWADEKAPEPVEWLTVQGVVKPGEVGATPYEFGVFYIRDKGIQYYGAQLPYFKEFFLYGKKYTGRWVYRLIPRRRPVTARAVFLWQFGKPIDQRPYVLSRRAVRKEWIPPRGVSALPPEIRKQIPEECQYWKVENRKKRLEVRAALVSAIKKGQVKIIYEGVKLEEGGPYPYVLQHHYWKKRKLIREAPCLHPDTVVLTAQGIKRANEVKIKDKLPDVHSFTQVERIEVYPNDTWVEIKIEGNPKLIVSPEHPFYVFRSSYCYKGHNCRLTCKRYQHCTRKERKEVKLAWVPASELTSFDYAFVPDVCIDETFENPLPELSLKESGYLLGTLVADGCLTNPLYTSSIALGKSPDIVLLRLIKKLTSNKVRMKYLKSARCWYIEWNDANLQRRLAPLIYTNDKKKTFPLSFLNAPREFKESFLKGLMHDGWIHYKDTRNIDTTSSELAARIYFLATNLHYGVNIQFTPATYRIVIAKFKKHSSFFRTNTGTFKKVEYVRKFKKQSVMFNLITSKGTYILPNALTHNSAQHWDVRIKINNRLLHFVCYKNPARWDSVFTIRKYDPDVRWLKKEGYLPPGTVGNPTKDTPAWIKILSKGQAYIITDQPMFMRLRFVSGALKGLWIATREAPKSDHWILSRAELPKPK